MATHPWPAEPLKKQPFHPCRRVILQLQSQINYLPENYEHSLQTARVIHKPLIACSAYVEKIFQFHSDLIADWLT